MIKFESEFGKIFEKNIPTLKKSIMNEFKNYDSKGGYKVVWEEFEDVIDKPLKKFLNDHFGSIDISKAKTKSVFPDWKINWDDRQFAIDVKSGEDVMDPWYDMGRLDTFVKQHTKKYEQEYYITVKWRKDKDKIKVLDVYIEPFYKSIGYNSLTKGVKFRPYDGKLRPKSWDDFANNKCYWKTKTDFLKGLILSKKYRRVSLILEWVQEMPSDERNLLLKEIEKLKS